MAEKPTIGSLFVSILGDLSLLMRKEVELAKTELKEEATEASKGAGLAVGGLVLALFAFGALTFSLVHLLAIWLPISLSFFLVAVLYLAVTAILLLKAKAEFKRIKGLKLTRQSVKEDIQWLNPRS